MKLQQLGRSCHDLLAPQAAVFSLALTRALALALALCLGLMSGTAEASTYRLLLGASATQDSVTTATDSTFSVLDNSAFELDIGLQHVSTDAGDTVLGAGTPNGVLTWGMALSWYSVPGADGHGVAAGFVVEGAGGAIIAGTGELTDTTARSFSTDASVSLSGEGSLEDIFASASYSTTLVTITPSGETDMVSLWQNTLVLKAPSNPNSRLQCKLCTYPDLLTLRLRAVNLELAPSYARQLYHAIEVPDGDGTDLLDPFVDSYTSGASTAVLTVLGSTLTATVATANDAATISDLTSAIYGTSIELDSVSSSLTAILALAIADGGGDGVVTRISTVTLRVSVGSEAITPFYSALVLPADSQRAVPSLNYHLFRIDAGGAAVGPALATGIVGLRLLARASSQATVVLGLATPLVIADGGSERLGVFAVVIDVVSTLNINDIVDGSRLMLELRPSEIGQPAGVISSRFATATNTVGSVTMAVVGTELRLESITTVTASFATIDLTGDGISTPYAATYRYRDGANIERNTLRLTISARDRNLQFDLNQDLSSSALNTGFNAGFANCSGVAETPAETFCVLSSEAGTFGYVREISYYSSQDHGTVVASIPAPSSAGSNTVNLTLSMDVTGSRLATRDAVSASFGGSVVDPAMLLHNRSYVFAGSYLSVAELRLDAASTLDVYDLDDVSATIELAVSGVLGCQSSSSPCSAPVAGAVTLTAPANTVQIGGISVPLIEFSLNVMLPALPTGLSSTSLTLAIMSTATIAATAEIVLPIPTSFTVLGVVVPPSICDGDLDSVASPCLSVDSAELRAYSATLLFSELASDRAQLSEAATAIDTAASYWLAFHTGTTCAIASITTMSSQLSLSATGGSGQLNALSQGTAYCVFLVVEDAGGSTATSAPVLLNTAAFSLTDADNDGLSDDLEYDFMPVGGLTVACPGAASSCDTDGDGLSDSLEAYLNSDLSDTTGASAATDADSDGLPDVVELYYGRRDELSSAATVLPRQNARGVLTDFASFTSGTASLSLPLDSVVHISAGVYQGGVLPAADSHNYVSGTHWLSAGSAASDAVIWRLALRPILSVGGDLSVIAGGSGSMRLQLLGAQPDGDGAVALSLSSSGLALMASSLSLSGAVEQAVGYTVSTSTLTVAATVQLDLSSRDLVSLCSFSASCSASTTYSIVYQPALRAVAAYAPVIQLRQSGSSALLQSIADPAAGVEFSVSGSVVNGTRTWTLSVLGSSTPATPEVALAGTYSVAGSVFGSNAAVYRIGAVSAGESLQRVFSVGQLDSDGDLIPDELEAPGLALINSALPFSDSAGTANAHFMLVAPGIILRLGDIAARRSGANSPRVPLSEFAALGIAPLPVSLVDNLVLDVSFSCGDSAACFSAGDLINFVFSVDGAISTDKLYHYSSTCPSAATASWCEVDTSQRTITIDSGPGTSSATVIVVNTVTFSPYLSVAGTNGRACPAPGDAAYLPLLSLAVGALSNGGCVHVSGTSDSFSPIGMQATSGSEVVVFRGGGGTIGLPWLALLALMLLLSLGRSGQWHRRGVAMAGAALLSLCLSLPATAAALDFGISGAVGQSFLKPSLQSNTFRLDDQEDFAYRVGVDYALPFKLPLFVITLEDLWLEGFWADLGESRVCNATACGGVEQTAAGAGVNWFPYGRDRRWSPYAALGWRSGDAKSRQFAVAVKNDDDLYWGLGMELDLAGNPARGLALKIFYEDYDAGAAFAGAGLSYRFNDASAAVTAPRRDPQTASRRREQRVERAERTEQSAPSRRQLVSASIPSPCKRPSASVCACLDTVRGNRGWYVQVAAYANIESAERTAKRLLAQGLGAVRVGIGAVETADARVLYAVRLALDSPTACGRAAVIKRDVDELLNVESMVRAWFDYPW